MSEAMMTVERSTIERSRAYRHYALGLMTAVYMLNLVDRGLINLLLQPIKIDLQLSDTQLGFVTGIAFGLFYAVAGLPLARWSDRGDRANIAAASIGLWGLTVMGCVFVGNFVQLVVARVAAAIGEAGCKPPTYSLVGDYFPKPVERTRAMSIYWVGAPLAALISFIVGGWLNEQVGWRLTFFIMGIPGLMLALLVKFTLYEPRRHLPIRPEAAARPPMRSAFSAMWRQRSSRHLSIAIVLFYMLGFGMGPWYSAFMMRLHGMGSAELGVWLGLIHGIGGLVGILLGGDIASRWFADNEPAQMRVTAIMIASLVPLTMGFLFIPDGRLALLMLVPQTIALYFFFAPAYTLLQRLVADDIRALSLAIVSMLSHLIGMGIGPQLVGILSDLLAPRFGIESLRYAMLVVSFVALWSGYHYLRVARTVRADLAASEESRAQIGN